MSFYQTLQTADTFRSAETLNGFKYDASCKTNLIPLPLFSHSAIKMRKSYSFASKAVPTNRSNSGTIGTRHIQHHRATSSIERKLKGTQLSPRRDIIAESSNIVTIDNMPQLQRSHSEMRRYAHLDPKHPPLFYKAEIAAATAAYQKKRRYFDAVSAQRAKLQTYRKSYDPEEISQPTLFCQTVSIRQRPATTGGNTVRMLSGRNEDETTIDTRAKSVSPSSEVTDEAYFNDDDDDKTTITEKIMKEITNNKKHIGASRYSGSLIHKPSPYLYHQEEQVETTNGFEKAANPISMPAFVPSLRNASATPSKYYISIDRSRPGEGRARTAVLITPAAPSPHHRRIQAEDREFRERPQTTAARAAAGAHYMNFIHRR